MANKQLKIGIVGACGRGASFKSACDAVPEVKVRAVCDTYVEGLEQARQRLGAEEKYADFGEMLEKCELDAVIVGTPMHFHVPQSIAALDRGLHVLSEVPAGVSVDECRDLVIAARRSKGVYMMAENYTYLKENVLVRELVKAGLFGQTYFAEGEYIHELKGLNEQTKWRRKWQTGINGNTYPTHSLGPILQWMPGDRVASVACAGSGHHHTDASGREYEQEDSILSLNRMTSGGLVKLRIDMLSDRPHAMTNYQLQGTDGAYESPRSPGEPFKLWLRSRCKDPNKWTNLWDLEQNFLPILWKEASDVAKKAGHGGGDYFEVIDFVDACLGRRPPEIDIDLAMDMTLPGLASQQSIAESGRWVSVPDSRDWKDESSRPKQQLRMKWPNGRSAPAVNLPAGYRLRQLTQSESDLVRYQRLMNNAGFDGWDPKQTRGAMNRALPGGYFVIEHEATGDLVATAFAAHCASDAWPNSGSLEYVAGDANHKGKGLGLTICAAVVKRLLDAGYQDVYLTTDDWRLPAIATYLKQGWEPVMCGDDMPARWDAVRRSLKS